MFTFARATRGVSVRLVLGAPGPGLASPAQGRAGLRRWPPGSGLRAHRRSLSAPLAPSSHRGGWRVPTGRALHSLYALARCKTRLILSIYDESRLLVLQRSAVENRAARTTYSASVAAVSRTEEAPGWVTSGAADVTAEHHMHCGHARFTQQHRSRAVPRPAGHALCMLLPCSPAATCETSL